MMLVKMNSSHWLIPIDVLADGSTICFKNAYRLAQDAKLLFTFERYSTCISVAVLALEELGKGYMLMSAHNNKQNTIPKISKNDFKSHVKKIEIISTTFKMSSKNDPAKKPSFDRLSGFLNMLSEKKMESWYVDWDDGQKQWCHFDDHETGKQKMAAEAVKAIQILIIDFIDKRGHDEGLKVLANTETIKLFSAHKIYGFCNKCSLRLMTNSELSHHIRVKSHGGYLSWHWMQSETSS